MNTFFDLAKDANINSIFKVRAAGLNPRYLMEHRTRQINLVKRINLMRKITLRGNNEQFTAKFHAPANQVHKRLSRSHVFTMETIP